MKQNRRQFLKQSLAVSTAVAAGALGFPAIVKAQRAPIIVRLGDTISTDSPEYIAHQYFAKRISEATKGEYEVKLFPNSVLGGHTQMNEQIRNGTLEMAKSGQGYPTTYDKRLGIFSLPYLYTDRSKLYAALDGRLGEAYAKISEQYGLTNLGFFDSGIRNVYNRKGAFKTPEELARLKLKLRVMPDQIMIATFNLLGTQATPLEIGEVYNAMQQGVVDGAENAVTFYISSRHIEAAKYFTKTQHLFGVDPIFVSTKWFNAQPANIQKIFRDVMRESIENERKIWVATEMADYGRAAKLGAIIGEADIPAFQRKAKPIWEQNKTNLSGLFEIVEATQ